MVAKRLTALGDGNANWLRHKGMCGQGKMDGYGIIWNDAGFVLDVVALRSYHLHRVEHEAMTVCRAVIGGNRGCTPATLRSLSAMDARHARFKTYGNDDHVAYRVAASVTAEALRKTFACPLLLSACVGWGTGGARCGRRGTVDREGVGGV